MPSSQRLFYAGLWCFLLTLAIRLPFVIALRHQTPAHESYLIALSIARSGTYADAYGPGSGPTAHCMPIQPMLLAAALRLFGTGQGGNMAIAGLNALEMSLASAFLPWVAARLGLGVLSGVIAGSLVAVPLNFYSQFNDFEACLSSLAMVLLIGFAGLSVVSGEAPWRRVAAIGLAVGCSLLESPTFAPIVLSWMAIGLFAARQAFWRAALKYAVVGALACLCLAPWAYRNYRQLGSVVWSRSNFGLNLLISNRDDASPSVDQSWNTPAFAKLEPYTSKVEFDKVKRLGEVEYNRSCQREAAAWIQAHPRQFASLAMWRVIRFWFPSMLRPLQTIGEALMTIAGLVGLAWLSRINRRSAEVFLGVVVGYPAIHLLIESSARYRLPVEPVLLLLGSWAAIQVFEIARRRPT